MKIYQVPNIDKALIALANNTAFNVEEEGTISISVSADTDWFHYPESEQRQKISVLIWQFILPSS